MHSINAEAGPPSRACQTKHSINVCTCNSSTNACFARVCPQEKTTLKLDFQAEGIFGGSLVGVKASDYIVFYDWDVSDSFLSNSAV